MTKEDLEKLKEWIGSLSKEELNERYLYLRGLATGEIQGPPIGYPDLDERWLKNYSVEDITSEYIGQTFYQFLYSHNQKNLDVIALRYLVINVTFRELFKKIDECARSLIGMGIKEGNTVGICAPTTPETVYLLYAINKIGAVANLIDIRKKSEDIEYCLNVHDDKIEPVKLLFVYDGQIDRVSKILPKTSVEKIVSVSPLESFPSIIRFIYNSKLYLQSTSKDKDFYSYSDFLKAGRYVENVPETEYDENKVSFIEYTSGSMNFPKVVALNDSTGNHRVFQYMHNGMKYDIGDTYLNIIPIFLAFGAFVGIHLPLSMGMTDELIPSFDVSKIYSYFRKSKAKHMTLTPASFVELIHDKKFQRLNLSRMRTLGCGGDGINATGEKIIVDKLRERKCKVPLNNGYGCSEIGAPFCTQKNDVAKLGSVGIPLPGNNIVIFKHNTLEEVPVNTVGDVCMVVDYPMLRYISNKDMTENVMIHLPDGRIGIRLEDAGYVDEDGNIFIKGRYDNAIIKDGKYIWPVDVEDIIMQSDIVKMCCVVPMNDEEYDCRLFIVPEETYCQAVMDWYISAYLKEFNLKMDVVCVSNLELTSSGKVDRKKLKVYTK